MPTRMPSVDGLAVDLGARDGLAALAAAVRSLVEATVKTEVGQADLDVARSSLAQADEVLRRSQRNGSPPTSVGEDGRRRLRFLTNPVLGVANPIAPPVELRVEDGVVVATVTLSHVYEGPPGFVHGGVLSLILDQTLSLANLVAGSPGMTKSLHVDYRAPTPLDTPLEIRSEHDRVDGRDIHCLGTISAGGRVTVEAEGIFRSPPRDKGAAYFKDHFSGG